ncbi:MAG: septum site-determining protein MinC [Aquificae bacterium]|nr:septum site-determining protein MinC [Aquificota bacterium]
MIEIKGRTAPVIYIKIKEKGRFEDLLTEVRKKLSTNLFKGSLVFIENPEVLTPQERKILQEEINKLTKGVVERGKPQKRESRLLIIRKNLRAGQRVEHRGDVLILGDVNRDAEVIAGGNIIVFGKLRGIAKAGLIGDEDAVIVAMVMEPQLLQIGKKKAIPSESDERSPGYPEVAKIENGQIILEAIEGAERWQKLLS